MDGMRDATTLEKRMMARAAALGRPINGSLELTPLCTMDCGMCYVRLNRQDMAEIYRIGQGRLAGPPSAGCAGSSP